MALRSSGTDAQFLRNMHPLDDLKKSRFFNEKYIYPNNISTFNKDTVYISAPMSSILKNDEYKKQRTFLLQLADILKKEMGFRNIICPAIKISNRDRFDGNTKAIRENFTNLKQVDHLIVLYPHQSPTSTLIEAGYGIALTKIESPSSPSTNPVTAAAQEEIGAIMQTGAAVASIR